MGMTPSRTRGSHQLATSRRAIAKELEIDEAHLITASSVTKKGIDEIRREMIARL